MQNHIKRQSAVSGGWGLGVFLIVAGVIFLMARLLNVDVGQYGWPLLVILAGITFLGIGLSSRISAGFVVPGSIISMVGLILAVQNTFGLWAAWSYAWALVFPFAVGIGLALLGMRMNQPDQVRVGTRMAGMGVVLFLVFGAFFEGILHVSGVDLGSVGDLLIPLVLIGSGMLLIVLRMAGHRPANDFFPPAPPVPPVPPAPPSLGPGGAQ
jgi:hypothetical protein